MVRIRFLFLFFAMLAAAFPAQADDAVNVRASAKDDYTRIVFEGPKAPSYITDQTSSQLTLKFQSAASFKVEGAAPTTLPRVTSYKTPDNKTAVIGFASGQEVRHFEIGNRIIVDIRGPATGAAASATPAATAKAETPAPVPTSVSSKDPKVTLAKAAPVPVMKVDKVSTMPAGDIKTAAAEAQAAIGGPTVIQVTSTQGLGLAVFKRFGNLWIVIDTPDLPLSPEISGVDAKKFGTFERIALKEATAFRLALPDNRPFHVEGGGLVWKIIADNKDNAAPATVFKKLADAKTKKASLLWPVPAARRIIDLNDPVVGDTLKVVTVDSAKSYSGDVQDYVQFDTLQDYAGLSVESKIDNLKISKVPEGILIATDEGISVSPESDTAFLEQPAAPVVTPTPASAAAPNAQKTEAAPQAPPAQQNGQVLKLSDWKMGEAQAVDDNRRILMAGLKDKDDSGKAQDLMTLAKMELSHGRGPEAEGYLDLAAQFLPDLGNTPEYKILHGVATSLAGEFEQALKDFSKDNVKDIPEVALWKAYTLAGLEDWKQASQFLPSDFSQLDKYPDEVKTPVALALAEVALRDGDLKKAHALMDTIKSKDLILPYQSALNYLKGEAARQEGHPEDAEKLWKDLKDGKDDLYRAKAGLALTALQLEQKELKPADAIDRLEGLRYAWRGDELETSVNYKLGQMYIANNDPLKGLALLRQAASLSPGSDQSKKINDEMASTFAQLFEPNRIKNIDPVDAISLYNEFSGLAPQGEEDDKILRQLADRLVDADLLPRAAALLQTQIDGGKVNGIEGATTAIRLASIYNQDSQPEKAMQALAKASEFLKAGDAAKGQPNLVRQITLLRAEALADQKKPDEAFVALAGLPQNAEVLKLRADIAWQNKRWQDAADALESLVQQLQISPSRPATEEDASTLLNWAVALYLADNRYVLANLREKYSTAMAASSKAKQFEVVTRPRQSALLADRDTINSIIDETDIFKGFVDSSKASAATSAAQAAQTPAKNVEPVKPAVPPQAPADNTKQ